VIDYLYWQRGTVNDFLVGAGAAHAATLPKYAGQPAPRHYLRVTSITSSESLGISQTRSNTNRGSGYVKPGELNSFQAAMAGIFPNYDCKNTDYTQETTAGSPETADEEQYDDSDQPPVNGGFAPCVITRDSPSIFGGERFPQLFPEP
jgi:hypothetical protein